MALNVTELDFDGIKANLISHLEGQSEFNDFDFTGSAINTLLDTFAYTIHYMGIHANMAINETFLDSAILRSSVVARAKEIGYVPRQITPATATFKFTLDLTAEDSPPTTFTVPKGTTFSASNSQGTSFSFTTTDEWLLLDEGIAAGGGANKILSNTITVYQGKYNTQEWVVDSVDDIYIIEQNNVDTINLQVTVKETEASSNKVIWANSKSFTTVSADSEVYFVQETDDKVELYFGNDVIGKQLEVNNVVIAEFITTTGEDGNGLKNFSLDTGISVYQKDEFTLTEITNSTGGASREDITSIKQLAPLDYQRQNRAVTAEDYKTIILNTVGDIEFIHVWGGEDNDPPVYGKVFVSIKPSSQEYLSVAQKTTILNAIQQFNVVGILPEIVDPTYLFVSPTISVNYNKDKTTLQINALESKVAAAVDQFFTDSTLDYDITFKYSSLLAAVDASDSSIISNTADIQIYQLFTPNASEATTYYLDYKNSIEIGTVLSDIWTDINTNTQQLKDDGLGNIDRYVNGSLQDEGVGTVDYVNGTISIIDFDANVSTTNTSYKMKITPDTLNINVVRNHLFTKGDVIVNAIAIER